ILLIILATILRPLVLFDRGDADVSSILVNENSGFLGVDGAKGVSSVEQQELNDPSFLAKTMKVGPPPNDLIDYYAIGGTLEGRWCNNILSVSHAMARAIHSQKPILLWGDFDRLFDYIDIEHMLKNTPSQMYYQRHQPAGAVSINYLVGVYCGLHY